MKEFIVPLEDFNCEPVSINEFIILSRPMINKIKREHKYFNEILEHSIKNNIDKIEKDKYLMDSEFYNIYLPELIYVYNNINVIKGYLLDLYYKYKKHNCANNMLCDKCDSCVNFLNILNQYKLEDYNLSVVITRRIITINENINIISCRRVKQLFNM